MAKRLKPKKSLKTPKSPKTRELRYRKIPLLAVIIGLALVIAPLLFMDPSVTSDECMLFSAPVEAASDALMPDQDYIAARCAEFNLKTGLLFIGLVLMLVGIVFHSALRGAGDSHAMRSRALSALAITGVVLMALPIFIHRPDAGSIVSKLLALLFWAGLAVFLAAVVIRALVALKSGEGLRGIWRPRPPTAILMAVVLVLLVNHMYVVGSMYKEIAKGFGDKVQKAESLVLIGLENSLHKARAEGRTTIVDSLTYDSKFFSKDLQRLENTLEDKIDSLNEFHMFVCYAYSPVFGDGGCPRDFVALATRDIIELGCTAGVYQSLWELMDNESADSEYLLSKIRELESKGDKADFSGKSESEVDFLMYAAQDLRDFCAGQKPRYDEYMETGDYLDAYLSIAYCAGMW